MRMLTQASVVLLVLGMLLLGRHWLRWRQAENDAVEQARKAAAAARFAWKMRGIIALTGFFVFALGWVWLHAHGHATR